MQWAEEIGAATLAVVRHQLDKRPHPEHGYRACLGLLIHARGDGKARLEAACARALAIHSPSDQNVTSILNQGLDQLPIEPRDSTAEHDASLPLHGNVRGALRPLNPPLLIYPLETF